MKSKVFLPFCKHDTLLSEVLFPIRTEEVIFLILSVVRTAADLLRCLCGGGFIAVRVRLKSTEFAS